MAVSVSSAKSKPQPTQNMTNFDVIGQVFFYLISYFVDKVLFFYLRKRNFYSTLIILSIPVILFHKIYRLKITLIK